MKLRRIELDQVRRFERPVVVEGLSDGLNVVAGPNEVGKSTLLAALQAVLFLKHTSSRARDLQHHRHATAPRVAVDFELDGAPFRLEKRFLQRPRALLVLPDGRRLEGDAAEHELQRLLCGPRPAFGSCPGLWNLLLVGQGAAIEHEVAQDARGALQASLEANLDTVTGSESAKTLMARLEDVLYGQKDGLIDRRNGRPKGRYRALEAGIEVLEREIGLARRRQEQLAGDVARLTEALARHEGLAAEDARAEPSQELARLEARLQELMQLAEARTAAAQAELAVRQAQERQQARAQLAGAAAGAAAAVEQAAARLEAAQRTLETRIETGTARASEAERLRRAAAAMGELETVSGELDRLRAALDDGAAEIAFGLEPAALARVRLNGQQAWTPRFRVKVRERLELEVAGVGRIEVRAALAGRLSPELERLAGRRQALHEVLAGHGITRLEAGAEREGSAERLAQALAGADARVEAAREAWREARHEAEIARRELAAARRSEAELARSLGAAQAAAGDAELAREAAAAAAALARARAEVDALAARVGEDDAASLRRRIAELRGGAERRRAERAGLEREIEGLSSRIETLEGHGLKEELDELERRRALALDERAALAHEVAVLRLLHETLAEAEREVREEYLRPLVARLQPLLDDLLPGAEVGIDERLQIVTVSRPPHGPEAFEQLSHGTREQLAVLARLAFADLLSDAGQPCFVVLDDALVYSDDGRLERMFRVLEGSAQKVQILLLTCRERAFERLQATRPGFMELTEHTLESA